MKRVLKVTGIVAISVVSVSLFAMIALYAIIVKNCLQK